MKGLKWVGSSKKDLLTFPDEVQQEIGYALHMAQCGETYQSAAFQKKSKKGIAIPKNDAHIIEERLKRLKQTLNKED